MSTGDTGPELPPGGISPEDYQAAVEAINKPNAELRAYACRTRKWVVATFIAVIISLAGLVLAASARQAACDQGNKFREGDLKLWNTVLALPPSSPETPQELQNRQTFTVFLKVHDKLVHCSYIP